MSTLPDAYQKVEYIKTSGTQYIDTGFTADQDTRFLMKIKYIAGNFIFGSDGDTSGKLRAVGLNSNQGIFRWHYDSLDFIDSGDASYNNIYNIDINKNIMYLNGTLSATFTYTNFSTPSTVIISGIRRGNQIKMSSYGSSLEVYRFKIYDNGLLVRDFIPCYRKSDSEIGMYDTVNNVFYTNAGTGTFEKGADVIELPETYQRLKYIQSSGTQYIDTGIAPNNNTKVETKFFNNSLGSWYIFGSRDSELGIIYAQTGSTRNDTIYARIGDIISETGWTRLSDGALYEVKLETKTNVFDYSITDLTNNQTFIDNGVSYTSIPNDVPNILICALKSDNIQDSTTRIYYFKLYQDGALVKDFIPCYRKLDDEVGLYDLANSGKNLLNSKLLEQGGLLDATGAESSSTTRVRTPYVEVLDNTFYTISNSLYTIRVDLNDVAYIHCYDSNKNYLGVASNQTRYNEKAYTFKTLTNTKYIRAVFQKANASSEITVAEVKTANPMIEQNNRLTSYEPYDGFYLNAGTGTFSKGAEIPINLIGGVDVAKGGGIEVVNGTLTTYLANSTTIDANTFIQIVNGKVEVATTQIDGVTVSKCTTTSAGKVYVL